MEPKLKECCSSFKLQKTMVVEKALASISPGLAIMGAGAQMGTPVQTGANNGGSAVQYLV